MNNITISGNLGGEPELQYVGDDDIPVARFSVAEDHGYGTNWLNVEAWGDMAETIDEYFHTGDWIEVNGSLEQDSYEKNGETRNSYSVRAATFGFGGGTEGPEGSESGSSDDEFEDDAPF